MRCNNIASYDSYRIASYRVVEYGEWWCSGGNDSPGRAEEHIHIKFKHAFCVIPSNQRDEALKLLYNEFQDDSLVVYRLIPFCGLFASCVLSFEIRFGWFISLFISHWTTTITSFDCTFNWPNHQTLAYKRIILGGWQFFDNKKKDTKVLGDDVLGGKKSSQHVKQPNGNKCKPEK